MKKTCIGIGFLLIAGLIWMTQGTVQAQTATLPVFSPAPPSETVTISKESLEFPIVLRNASLIVTDIVSFDGILPGEKEDIYAVGVLSLLVYNPRNTGIVCGTITLTRGDETFYFDLEYLPGGSKALVLERNAKSVGSGSFDSCQCLSFSTGDFSDMRPGIQITEENGYFTVLNLSDAPSPALAVYYKQHTPADGLYIGKAMSVQFDPLQPGESQTLPAYGYADGYSRIAAIIPK